MGAGCGVTTAPVDGPDLHWPWKWRRKKDKLSAAGDVIHVTCAMSCLGCYLRKVLEDLDGPRGHAAGLIGEAVLAAEVHDGGAYLGQVVPR